MRERKTAYYVVIVVIDVLDITHTEENRMRERLERV